MIEFNDSKSSFFIRASLLSDMPCLAFPPLFSRARKNSVDLFNEVLMKRVTGTTQYSNERSFSIDLEDGYSVLFKMHGNRSNVVLIYEGKPVQIFKQSLAADLNIVPHELHRNIDWSKETFTRNLDSLEKLYFTFGKPVWMFLKLKGFDEAGVEKKWQMLNDTLIVLNNPAEYFINEYAAKPYLSLLKFGNVENTFSDSFEAVTVFRHRYLKHVEGQRSIDVVVNRLREEVRAHRNYIKTAAARLDEIENDEHYKVWGDILMANLHAIPAGVKSVELQNFYADNALVTIPLDERLSPQKNAERYYRKSKNTAIEIDRLKQALQKRRSDLQSKESMLQAFTDKFDEAEMHAILEKQRAELREEELEEEKTDPFWHFEYKGFHILVGKNAAGNDELTMKWAHKNDLWLHARDVPGSHVIIRQNAGKPFPKDVIEYAAGIAAWNSKRKTESLCPVIVTPKKFVRKRKGDPPGAVVVDREEVILIEPRSP
ncbi:MAG TPA: NFACT RNA binding domain-containing protein [Cyclobacteriaceae bacterium]|nr:NFACT RNA binding domain-containing protein [Cyclobacteriaceae bacterium]